MLQIPAIRLFDPFFQAGLCLPTQCVYLGHIQKLSSRAVGLRRIKRDASFKSDHPGDPFRQIPNGYVFARTHIDNIIAPVMVHNKYARIGQVVHIQKFPPWLSGAPNRDFRPALNFCFMAFSHQRRQDMRSIQVEVVIRPVKIGGHHTDEVGSVLAIVRLAHLDACDFGHGIGFVCRLQVTGKEMAFFHGLWTLPGINARAAQKHELAHPVQVCAVNNMRLYRQIRVNKIRPLCVVGQYAPDLCGSQKHEIRFFLLKKGLNLFLPCQVQRIPLSRDNVLISDGLEFSDNRRSHHPAVTGDKDF